MHKVCADEACEGERTGDDFLGGLCHAQQQEGDQGDGTAQAALRLCHHRREQIAKHRACPNGVGIGQS